MMDAMMISSSRDGQEERVGNEGEIMTTDEKSDPSSANSTNVDIQAQEESRDDCGAPEMARNESSDRDERQDVSKKPTKAPTTLKHKKTTNDRSTQARRNPQESHPAFFQQNQPGRGVVSYHPPHPGMHGNNGPRGHPNTGPYTHPPYGYPGNPGPYDPHRGPHQHHMHYALPPMPHPGQQGPYASAPGAFLPAQHHHPGYGGGPYHHPHPYPYHGAMHQQRLPSFQQANPASSEDTGSIGSTKSKSSKSGKSTTGSSASTTSKKRTIDGVDQRLNASAQQQGLTSAFSFRRTSSNISTSSTVTAGNNTSTETPNLTEDSPKKGRDLPPLSSRPDYQGAALDDSRKGYHRRDLSGASTASSLSVGGLSLSSYDTRGSKDAPLVRSSPKRRRGQDGGPLLNNNDSDGTQSLSLKGLETTNNHHRERSRENLFLTLSTSPINSDVEATPVSKNTMKATSGASKTNENEDTRTHQAIPSSRSLESMDRSSGTPTPPLPNGSAESDMITDEHLLNRHLRGQSFTPLPHIAQYSESREGNASPPGLTQNPSFSTLGAQLSWDITGDAPSLGGLGADSWEEDHKPSKADNRRPGSAGSAVSPAPFAVWKEGEMIPSSHYQLSGGDGKNYDNIRLSALSPHSHSDVDMDDSTTPLPLFFDHENGHHPSSRKDNQGPPGSIRTGQAHFGDPEHIHQLFITNGGRGSDTKKNPKTPMIWSHPGQPKNLLGPHQMRFPPTPVYTSSDQEGFGRSPHHGERRDGPPDFFPSNKMLGMHHGHAGMNIGGPNDRIRNLRGRAPPGQHRVPMAHHQLPPHLTPSHPHNLTSPIGVGQMGKGMWSPGGGLSHSLHSPHRMVQSDSPSSSKRKCISMKPPLPTKFQGDIEKFKTAHVPEFTSLVNYPSNMTAAKTSTTLPEGVRCCVMCGSACPCSAVGKNKKNKTKTSGDGSLAARNVQNAEKQGLAIIPTQNKGLCTLCDVNVWIVATSGLEIKWCKGCKNFRPWAAFGDKGLATKCLRCRDRQREKYAIQKEEKERTRMISKPNKV